MTSEKQLSSMLAAARKRLSQDSLANWIGYELEKLERGQVQASMMVDPKHIAPNGFLHATVSIALADITCGVGSAALLRNPGEKITTVEIKTNHLGTALAGRLVCTAIARHAGGSTHVWDADVVSEATNKTIMIFRCTQMVLRSRRESEANM
ncbi:PaaI family thioesterase [Desulfovibrio sp. OttesenSCG-928-O18]|nr:PaaI family thioesterase [Desulfovibrio sp. OttesenSCG-928-O18]